MSDTIMGKGENNSPHVLLWPHLSLWLCSRLVQPVWMGALRHTGGLIEVESDPLLSELQSIRLSHFDSPSSLNCSVNLAAALSCLTYWSPESVLQVLCPTNRLLCPPSPPHRLSTRSDRPVMMILAPPPLSPAPKVPNHYLISSIHHHMQIQHNATDERKQYFLFSKVIQTFSMDFAN